MVVMTEARSGSMNVTPAAVATATRSIVSTRTARQRLIVDGRVQLRPWLPGRRRIAEHDRRPGRGAGEPLLVVGRVVVAEDFGETRGEGGGIADVVDRRHEGGAAAAARQVGDPGEVEGSDGVARGQVHGRQPVRRCGDHPGAVVGHEQALDRMVQRRDLGRLDAGAPSPSAIEAELDGRESTVVVADDELPSVDVDGQRAHPGSGDRPR